MGRHIANLSPDHIVNALRWSWAFQLMAIALSVLGKLAIIAFLLEIRGRQGKPWFLWGVAGTTIIINLVVWATILNKLWNDALPGNCNRRVLNQNYSFFQASMSEPKFVAGDPTDPWSSGWNSAMDVALAIYPTFVIWGLQMKRSVKIGLSVLMGLGVL